MKAKRRTQIEGAVAAAWKLVETCGLSKRAFQLASVACIEDALWLIARGAPIRRVIKNMNEEAYAGERVLRKWRRRKQRELNRQLAEAHRGSARNALAAADLAAVLARLNPGALVAELDAHCAGAVSPPFMAALICASHLRKTVSQISD